MSKLTLNDVGSGYNLSQIVNANSTATETAIENTLSRNGQAPNEMLASLDMNSKKIINVGSPSANTDAARWIDVTSAVNITGLVAPSVSGNNGKFLGTDGVTTTWDNPPAFFELSSAESFAGVTPVDAKYTTEPYGWINVKRYGATGDGTTDDTAAIANALLVANSGGTVYFPTGTYRITAGLRIAGAGVTLQGAGAWKSILVYAGATTSIIRVTDITNSNAYLHIKDLAVLGANAGDVLIDFTSVSLGTVENCRIWGGTTFASRRASGVRFSAATGSCYQNMVFNSDISYCTVGIQLADSANENRVFGGAILANTVGIQTSGTLSDCFRVLLCRIEDNVDGVIIHNFRDYLFLGNRFEKNVDGMRGITIAGGSTTLSPLTLVQNHYSGYAAGDDFIVIGLVGRVMQYGENLYEYNDYTGNGATHVGLGKLYVGLPTSSTEPVIQAEGSLANMNLVLTPKGTGVVASTTSFSGAKYALSDGIAAPTATPGAAQIYVDTADGDLKIIFGDGVIKTIVVDT